MEQTNEHKAAAMHEAEAYLRNEANPRTLYVRIEGRRRRLFINRDSGLIGIIAIGKRRRGYRFSEWEAIEKVYYPEAVPEADRDRMQVLKYQKLARLATHTNGWLRKIAAADPAKSLYENGITTGTSIDGKCIRLSTIGRYCGDTEVNCFREAIRRKEEYSSGRFDFNGYDGRLWCMPGKNGDMEAGFSKEYRNCANGYYYLLINDENVIGCDID